MKRFQNSSDLLEFWSLYNSSNKSILDVLEMIYLIFRKTIVKRVTAVKLGVYDGGGNCFGGVKVKVVMDTAINNVLVYCAFNFFGKFITNFSRFAANYPTPCLLDAVLLFSCFLQLCVNVYE